MAPVLRAALVLCVMLAAAPNARTQDQQTCIGEIKACGSTAESNSDFCRGADYFLSCVANISICGSSDQDLLRSARDRFRNQMRDAGCGAEGTAVVSVVTLLLSLAAALVWGQS